MIVAAVSSKSRIGGMEFNLSTTMDWIKSSDAQGVDFILFPELNLSGYIRDIEILKTVLREKEALVTFLMEISKNTNLVFFSWKRFFADFRKSIRRLSLKM